MTHRRPGARRDLGSAVLGVVILAVAGCGSGSGGSASPGPTAASPTQAASAAAQSPATPSGRPAALLEVLDFELEPGDLSVRSGTISIAVSNAGPTVHNVTIRDEAGKVLGATPDLREGESAALVATVEAGTYTLFCSLPGHESLGIKGTLTVAQP